MKRTAHRAQRVEQRRSTPMGRTKSASKSWQHQTGPKSCYGPWCLPFPVSEWESLAIQQNGGGMGGR